MALNTDVFFRKQLRAIVIPITIQNLMSSLVSASDAVMLGVLSQSSMAAVSLAGQIQYVLNIFYEGLIIGATILAAQYFGRGDKKSVERVLMIALRASLVISGLFFLAAFFTPGVLMHIFTGDALLIQMGVPYLRIVSISYLCMGISQMYLCIMKSSNQAMRSTLYSSSALLLNIFLNAIFIYGLLGAPRLEIRGAALATSIARLAELALVMMENHRKEVVHFVWKELFLPMKELRRDFYHYMMPAMGDLLFSGGFAAMNSVIMGHLGKDATAANSLAQIVQSVVMCACFGLASGSNIIVGNELGKGDLKKAKQYGHALCYIALVGGILSGILIFMLQFPVLYFAGTLTARAGFYLQVMLIVWSFSVIPKAMNCATMAGIFCAGGDNRFGLLTDGIVLWAIILPLGALAAFVWKVPLLLVFVILHLDELVKTPAVYRHYHKYRWLKNLTK